MTKTTNARDIGSLIGELMGKLGIATRVHEQRVLHEFERIMGPQFCKRATPVKIDHGVLFLQVVNSAWRQELFFQKSMIRERINSALGEKLVKEIILA